MLVGMGVVGTAALSAMVLIRREMGLQQMNYQIGTDIRRRQFSIDMLHA